jgi:hypothetical protein
MLGVAAQWAQACLAVPPGASKGTESRSPWTSNKIIIIPLPFP